MSAAAHGTLDVGGRRCRWLRQGELAGHPQVLLAHGAGAPYDSAFMAATAAGLVTRGCSVTRFHFPYMQRRVDEGGRRPPDRMPVLLDTWRAMLDKARGWKGVGPLVMSGKSMGGRVASMLLAEDHPDDVAGAVYLGYPLHPPGQPDKLRAAHLADVAVPQLFVSGTQDALAGIALLEPTVARLPSARLHAVEGGDHSLARRRSAPLEQADAWLDAVTAFVREVTGTPQGPCDETPAREA